MPAECKVGQGHALDRYRFLAMNSLIETEDTFVRERFEKRGPWQMMRSIFRSVPLIPDLMAILKVTYSSCSPRTSVCRESIVKSWGLRPYGREEELLGVGEFIV